MENFSFDLAQFLFGLLPGFILGLAFMSFFKPKAKKNFAASADDKTKLEKEVLSDEVKHLKDKIVTLEKALEMKLK